MSLIKFEGIKFATPAGIDATNEQIVDWLRYNLGLSKTICTDNPLINVDVRDCFLNVDKTLINEEWVTIWY